MFSHVFVTVEASANVTVGRIAVVLVRKGRWRRLALPDKPNMSLWLPGGAACVAQVAAGMGTINAQNAPLPLVDADTDSRGKQAFCLKLRSFVMSNSQWGSTKRPVQPQRPPSEAGGALHSACRALMKHEQRTVWPAAEHQAVDSLAMPPTFLLPPPPRSRHPCKWHSANS